MKKKKSLTESKVRKIARDEFYNLMNEQREQIEDFTSYIG